MRSGIRCCALGLLFLPALAAAFQIPKPAFSLNFGTGGDIEQNSDTAQLRKPPTDYWGTLYGSVNWWVFDAGLNLRYSSDDHFTTQRVNNYSFTPAWSWGRVYLGDFTTSFSEFTLSGIPLYGAGLELFPGAFRFGVVSGKARRASTDSLDWSYDRQVYGVTLGVDQFGITVLKAFDDTPSKVLNDSVPVAPEDNLVLGLSSHFRIINNLALDLDGGGSLFSHDVRSEPFQNDAIPDFAYRIYTPRLSTTADYALRAGVRYTPSFANLGIEVAQVGPGYTSLGLAGIANDYKHIRLNAGTSAIPKTNLSAYAELGNDNLAGDKLATSANDALGVTVGVTPLRQLSLAGSYSLTRLVKDAPAPYDSFDTDSRTQLISGGPNLNLDISGFAQTASVVASYQTFGDFAPFTGTPATRTFTVGFNYSITPRIPVTFATSFSHTYDFSDVPQHPAETYQSYSLGFSRAFFNDRFQNSLSVAYQPASAGRNIPVSGSHSYSITPRDVINLSWNLSFFTSSSAALNNFTARQASLSYNRRLF